MILKRIIFFLIIVVIVHIALFREYYFFQHNTLGVQDSAENWVEERIASELKNIDIKILSPENIEKFKQKIIANEMYNTAWIKINNDSIESMLTQNSIGNSGEKRYNIILNHLKSLQQNGHKLPECEFFLGVEDAWQYPHHYSDDEVESFPPVFVFAADNNYKFRDKLILFVDDHTLGNGLIGYRRGWSKIIHETYYGSKDSSYNKKMPKAFWRGLNNYTQLYQGKSLREKMIDIAAANPDIFDAAFNNAKTGFIGSMFTKSLRPVLQIFGIHPYYNIPQQLRYKILINIDGATATYPGYLYRLLSNSVVLKVESSNEQWFYNAVKPWQHYVPVNSDLSDITEKINWINTHDTEAIAIATRSTELVEKNFMPEHINYYIIKLLGQYKSLH